MKNPQSLGERLPWRECLSSKQGGPSCRERYGLSKRTKLSREWELRKEEVRFPRCPGSLSKREEEKYKRKNRTSISRKGLDTGKRLKAEKGSTVEKVTGGRTTLPKVSDERKKGQVGPLKSVPRDQEKNSTPI